MNKYVWIALALVIVLGGYWGVNALFSTRVVIPTTQVVRGPFEIALNVNGSVDAKQAYVLSAPRIRGLTITWLAPEGSMVQIGEPVLKFDASQQIADVTDHQSSLKINQTNLERSRNEYTIQEKQLELDLQKAQRNYDEMKHEAPKIAEEAKMELELAQLNFQAKLEQLKSDVAKAELEVQRAQDKVNKATRELEQMTMTAPIPGMVVYLEIWKGGSMSKVQEGDSPWPGQGLVNLPDLTEMVVKATASEVDASRIDSGQVTQVTLDAHPDTTYQGSVYKKGTLARRKEPGSKINVFDVDIDILEKDDKLKPGMSASCRVIIDRIPDVISVPLEAVFEKEGCTVVYLDNEREVEVAVGRRNDMRIEITSGLNGDERVCLINPTLEEPGLPGERASEPEMNKGRQSSRNPGQGSRKSRSGS
jgi:RND family efflux transporter MFP subunit